MRDARPWTEAMANKRWLTDGFASPVLYEYETERQMMNKVQKIKQVLILSLIEEYFIQKGEKLIGILAKKN